MKAFQVIERGGRGELWLVIHYESKELRIARVERADEETYAYVSRLRLQGYSQLPSLTITEHAFTCLVRWLETLVRHIPFVQDADMAALSAHEAEAIRHKAHRSRRDVALESV